MAIGSDLMNWLYNVIASRLWEMKWLIPIHVIAPCHSNGLLRKSHIPVQLEARFRCCDLVWWILTILHDSCLSNFELIQNICHVISRQFCLRSINLSHSCMWWEDTFLFYNSIFHLIFIRNCQLIKSNWAITLQQNETVFKGRNDDCDQFCTVCSWRT